MRLLIVSLFCCLACAIAAQEEGMPLTLVSYNCENLFDCRHDTLKDDGEFLPEGSHRWTVGRYRRKLDGIGRAISSCGGEGRGWRLPDMVALVEVENDVVMRDLTRVSVLRSGGYRYVMTDSPDWRGIDVALMYNPLTFRLLAHSALRVLPPEGLRPSRDVLYAKGVTRSADTLHVFVVHAPSRSGGERRAEAYRMAVARRIVGAVDSICALSPDANIVLAGDFNDYSYNKPLRVLGGRGLVEASLGAVGLNLPREVLGTYRYSGEWESLDHIFLSQTLVPKVQSCFILDSPWLLERDAQGRCKPRRTYLGAHYNGGVSDHLPIVLTLRF